jgi:hypothetical protein
MEGALGEARALLLAERPAHDALARALVAREVLSGAEVAAIVAAASLRVEA